ncbi:ABC transporter substrate-binding protein [Maritalea sp.]|uniref:ABC transporter substrate-binding protein n=1 Tax=Maritalea sp. TaxID=2003361 RepID=UPI003EF40670
MIEPLVTIKGMTWDHVRGFDPMVVTSEMFCDARHPHVQIVWEKRSLQAFADRPIQEMADEYDLMVIDHPHVGDIASSGILAAFDGRGRDDELNVLANQSVGVSHQSYNFEGRQWGLAIDAASPISARRPDLLKDTPKTWDDVVELAKDNQVVWPLIPINALMSFYNVLSNIGHDFGRSEIGIDPDIGVFALEQMKRVSEHLDAASFSMDPIAAFEWLSCRNSHSYCPYLYGYSNYSRRGFRPHLIEVGNVPSHADNGPIGSPIGGTGIAISSRTKYLDIALEYSFWIASAECQKGAFFDAGGQPANMEAWTDARCNEHSANFFTNTLETLEQSYLRPRHHGYMSFQDNAGDIVRDCLLGKRSNPDAVEAINALYQESVR